ncbi:hypothetical protein GCM10022280_17350 [Sphingomonas swuensis]|uniref:DUF1190 domain-containing protein n=1 Tax=Sphingomonas swuensis TaxID=977800 RepID=A0ABP7T0E8_9SPHN
MDRKLTLTATLAAALTGLSGCSSNGAREVVAANNTRICVDEWSNRIDDDYCEGRYGSGHRSSFLYLRAGSPIPYYYDNVRGAKYARYLSPTPLGGAVNRAPSSVNMSRSSAISRGGLGSSGRSFGRGG